MSLSLQQVLNIEIEKLVWGGLGLGHAGGRAVFVGKVDIGELVEVEITSLKKSHAHGQLKRVLRASPNRVSAPCAFFAECSGCDLQHFNYSKQVEVKNKLLQEMFGSLCLPLIPAEAALGYRSRIDLHKVGQSVGYHKERSHSLVPIDRCLLLSGNSGQSQIEELKNSKLPDGKYRLQANRKVEKGFSQVNSAMNELLKNRLVELSQNDPLNWIELYSGSGNFSFALLEANPRRIFCGVESDPNLVSLARERVVEKNLTPLRTQFLRSTSENFARRFNVDSGSVLLVDPPRAGLDPLVSSWANHQPFKKMYYISCNPMTFQRDLKLLSNWKLTYLEPFDLFPQTHHIEMLAVLTPLSAQ